jgi:hypothetical protein
MQRHTRPLFTLAACALFLVLAHGSSARAQPPSARDVEASLDDLDALDRWVAERCARGCGDVRHRLRRVRRILESIPRTTERQRGPRFVAMDPGLFQQLVARVRDAGSSDAQVDAIRFEAGLHYFSSAQVGDLIDALSFSETQLDALRALAPRIIDLERSGLIVDRLSFSATQEEARRILADASAAR